MNEMQLEEDELELEIRKELDAISLGEESVENYDFSDEENFYENTEGDFTNSLKLFLENSNRRKLNADLILSEAESMLNETNDCIASSRLSSRKAKKYLNSIAEDGNKTVSIDSEEKSLNQNENAEDEENIVEDNHSIIENEELFDKKEDVKINLQLHLKTLEVEDDSITAESASSFFKLKEKEEDDIILDKNENKVSHITVKIIEETPTETVTKVNEGFHDETEQLPFNDDVNDHVYEEPLPEYNLDDDLDRIQLLVDDIRKEKENLAITIETERKQKAACLIQTQFRGFSCRKKFTAMKLQVEEERHAEIRDKINTENNLHDFVEEDASMKHVEKLNESSVIGDCKNQSIDETNNVESDSGDECEEDIISNKIESGDESVTQPCDEKEYEEDDKNILEDNENSDDSSKMKSIAGKVGVEDGLLQEENQVDEMVQDDQEVPGEKIKNAVSLLNTDDAKGGEMLNGTNGAGIKSNEQILENKSAIAVENDNVSNQDDKTITGIAQTENNVQTFEDKGDNTGNGIVDEAGKTIACTGEPNNENKQTTIKQHSNTTTETTIKRNNNVSIPMAEDATTDAMNLDKTIQEIQEPNNAISAISCEYGNKIVTKKVELTATEELSFVNTKETEGHSTQGNNIESVNLTSASQSSIGSESSQVDEEIKQIKEWFGSKLSAWREVTKNLPEMPETKPIRNMRRINRKSSAAKRLQPFTDEELLQGAISFDKDEQSIECIDVVHISNTPTSRNIACISQCVHLTHLSFINCGLVSVEGITNCPVLKYIDVSHNRVNVISCTGMRRLEAFVARDNKLTSIHGLEGCASLTLVDFSNNNITKISGLNEATQLKDLRLSNNQLMDISDLGWNRELLHLDLSQNHLLSLDAVSECYMLKSLICSHNNFSDDSFGNLQKLIWLTHLDISHNNLTSFGFIANLWFPNLLLLDVSWNTIALTPPSNHTVANALPMLKSVDISGNLYMSFDDMVQLFKNCDNLIEIKLIQVLPTLNLNEELLTVLPCSEIITEEKESPTKLSPIQYFNKFYKIYSKTFSSDTVLKHLKPLQDLCLEMKHLCLKHNKLLLKSHSQWPHTLRDEHTLPLHCISQHCVDLQEIIITSRQQRNKLLLSEGVHSLALGFGKYLLSINTNDILSEKQTLDDSVHGIVVDTQLQQENHGGKNADSENLKGFLKTNHQMLQHFKPSPHENNSTRQSLSINKVYKQLKQDENIVEAERNAACKIQALFRGYRVRKVVGNILQTRRRSAIIIQSLWRGHCVRKQFKSVLEMCNKSYNDTFQMEEDPFNLHDLEFDEAKFDSQWSYSVDEQNQLFTKSNIDHHQWLPKPPTPVQMHHQPSSTHRTFTDAQKPPLPPMPSPLNTENERTYHEPFDLPHASSYTSGLRLPLEPSESNFSTSSSKPSSKQEVLTSEWGLKSSNTAALMLKRARKMKGHRRKQRTANEKFEHFREIANNPVSVQAPLRSNRSSGSKQACKFQKYDYPGEVVNPKTTVEHMEEERSNFTYEWLHSPANNIGKKKTIKSSSSAPGFLPVIPKSPSLVAAHDLELASVSSRSSRGGGNDVLRDIALRHERMARKQPR